VTTTTTTTILRPYPWIVSGWAVP